MVEAEYKYLAVADLSGFCGCCDHLDDFVHLSGQAGNFELQLWQEDRGVFGAAIDFRVALLTAVTSHLRDGQTLYADFEERVADLVELERLDDGHNDFHWFGSRHRRYRLAVSSPAGLIDCHGSTLTVAVCALSALSTSSY